MNQTGSQLQPPFCTFNPKSVLDVQFIYFILLASMAIYKVGKRLTENIPTASNTVNTQSQALALAIKTAALRVL